MKSMFVSLRLRGIRTLMALSLFCALPSFAADSSGAVISGAEITARNTATNESHGATSGDTGAFSIPNLQIGPYEITVKKEGFKIFHQSSVELTVAQVLTVNAALAPGAISEELTVVSDRAADVDQETSQLSNLVDSQQMASLPLITRNPYQLVLLSPGPGRPDDFAMRETLDLLLRRRIPVFGVCLSPYERPSRMLRNPPTGAPPSRPPS